MLRRFFLVVAVVCIAQAAFAIDFGIHYGQFDDIDDDYIGAEVVFPFGRNLTFIPSLDYVLADQVDAWLVHADVNYNFNRDATVNPYMGLGVGVFRVDFNVDGASFDDTDEIFSANGGVEFRAFETLRPYLQVRYFQSFSESESNDFGIQLGVRF